MELFVIGLIVGVLLAYVLWRQKNSIEREKAAATAPNATATPVTGPVDAKPGEQPAAAAATAAAVSAGWHARAGFGLPRNSGQAQGKTGNPEVVAPGTRFARSLASGTLVAVLLVCVTVVAITLLHEITRSTLEDSLLERIRHTLIRGIAPLGLGLAAGSMIFLISRRLANGTSGSMTAAEISGLISLLFILLLIAMDPSFRLIREALSNIREAKIPGAVELAFGPRVASSPEPSLKSSTDVSTSRADRLNLALRSLRNFPVLMQRDIDYSVANPVYRAASGAYLKSMLAQDIAFMKRVINPTIEAIDSLQAVQTRGTPFPLGGARFAATFQGLTQPADQGFWPSHRLELFRYAFDDEWKAICNEHDRLGLEGSDRTGQPYSECRLNWKAAAAQIEAFVSPADADIRKIYPQHSYRRMAAALLLFVAGEPDAALDVLDDLTTEQYRRFEEIRSTRGSLLPPKSSDEAPEFFPYALYRSMYLQTLILENEPPTPATQHRIEMLLARSMEVGDFILESPIWSDLLRKVESYRPRLGTGSDCLDEKQNLFKVFYQFHLAKMNDLAYVRVLRLPAPAARLAAARVAIDRVVGIDIRCLNDARESQMLFRISVEDTRAAVYAASLNAESDSERILADRACIAHASAVKARDTIAELQNHNASSPVALVAKQKEKRLLDIDAVIARDEERRVIVQQRVAETRQLARKFGGDRCAPN